jgi:hypothetical protein
MDNDKRYNAKQHNAQVDRCKIIAIAVIFLASSIAIFATKYRQEIIDFGRDVNTENVATKSDADRTEEKPTTEDTEEATTGVTTETPTTVEPTTETVTTGEEASTSEAEGGATLKYINDKDPDLSSKGDDWYDKKLFKPANATDDAYFDTAVIIGDSRTEGLSLYTGMSNLDAFCSKGLNIEKVMTDSIVSTDKGMITTLEALKLKQYDNIYISFGLNELGWVYDDIFIEDYKTFIDSVREIQPDATIYVENILPVSKKLSDEDEIYNNKNVKKFNKLLKRMCKDYGDIIYLDVASSVTVDGVLPADASTDGRHCNQEYCKKWLEYIRQNVYVRQ